MKKILCDRTRSSEILSIFNDAILNTTALYDYKPRTLAMMDTWFDVKEKGSYPVVGIVNEAGQLLAFGSYGIFRAWPAYKYSVEHSIYVEKSSRGKGYGRMVLENLIEEAKQQQYHNMIGGIDAQNAVSIALHVKCGFKHCGTVKHAGFKFGRWLDLDFYQLLLDGPPNPVDG